MMVLGTPCHLFLSFYFFLSWVVGVTGDGEPSSYLVRVDASMVSFSAQYIYTNIFCMQIGELVIYTL